MKLFRTLSFLVPFLVQFSVFADPAPGPRVTIPLNARRYLPGGIPPGITESQIQSALEKPIQISMVIDQALIGEYEFRAKVKKAFDSRQFDELESIATKVRTGKERTGSGSWKIVQFYTAIECSNRSPESAWLACEAVHHAWIDAKPTSITARVAYASFLVDYAWQARGGGYANTVTARGWELMKERLTGARQILDKLTVFSERDPYAMLVMMTVALGEGWSKTDFDALMDTAHLAEPKFWGYDAKRALSLLPRWHGAPGDWEKYAAECEARSGGLGAEAYARIVLNMSEYYENVFKETKASWESTKKGFQQMIGTYPESRETLHEAAYLAYLAGDRAYAKELFGKIGTGYSPTAWQDPTRFQLVKMWAESTL